MASENDYYDEEGSEESDDEDPEDIIQMNNGTDHQQDKLISASS